jgi:hypothetical protein
MSALAEPSDVVLTLCLPVPFGANGAGAVEDKTNEDQGKSEVLNQNAREKGPPVEEDSPQFPPKLGQKHLDESTKNLQNTPAARYPPLKIKVPPHFFIVLRGFHAESRHNC